MPVPQVGGGSKAIKATVVLLPCPPAQRVKGQISAPARGWGGPSSSTPDQHSGAEALGSLRWAFQRLRVAHPRLLDALAAEVRRQREAEGGPAH